MLPQQYDGDFFKESANMISEIRLKGDILLQNISHNPNVVGAVKKIFTVLDRFVEYLKFSDTDTFGFSALETIDVYKEVSADLKSANAEYRRGDRLMLDLDSITNVDDIIIPYCVPIMKQALYQIVDNAVKYSLMNSKLKIEKSRDSSSNRTTITFTNIGPKVKEEELRDIGNDIFCKSVRGENAVRLKPESGMGLGLNLVDMIIRCHSWIDARVYANSSEKKMGYNNIDYADFSITIDFSDKCPILDNAAEQLDELQKVMVTMFKHELAGSMPELTRLAYEVAIQCINSKLVDKSNKIYAYNLFDKITDFIFYLEGEGVSGRLMNLKNIPAEKMLDRFVRWAFVYRKGGLPSHKLWIGQANHTHFTPPLSNSFIVVAQKLAKYVVDEGTALTINSDKSSFEISSDMSFNGGIDSEDLVNKLFQENGLIISINNNKICIRNNEETI